MYLKNITCPICETKGLVLVDGEFYNCDECNYYWEIPTGDKKMIEAFQESFRSK